MPEEYVLIGEHMNNGANWIVSRGCIEMVSSSRELRMEEQEGLPIKKTAVYTIMPLETYKKLYSN